MSITKFVSIGEIALSYMRDGIDSKLPLIFINSLGSDMRIWDNMIPRLAEQFAIIRYDKRGHGLSDCPAAPYSIRNHADDLAGLLDALEVDEAILIGISVGGMIALDFAARYPQRIKALVLSDTAAKIGTEDMWNERINTLRANSMEHLADAILARWFRPNFASRHPAAFSGYYNMLTRTPLQGYTGTCEALRDADLRETTGDISIPSLVLCGTEDSATPPELVQGLASSLPNAHFELIQEAGHLPCIEQPDQMAATIKQFLEDNSYAG